MSLSSLASLVVEGFETLLVVFSQPDFALGLLAICGLFSIYKTKSLAVPFAKLLVVYSIVFLAVLFVLFGKDELISMESLKDVPKSLRAAKWAFFVCFGLGLVTPKKARQSLKGF